MIRALKHIPVGPRSVAISASAAILPYWHMLMSSLHIGRVIPAKAEPDDLFSAHRTTDL